MKEKDNSKDPDTMIKITNLVKDYKMFDNKTDRLLEAVVPKVNRHSNFRALDNLNLEVKKGEVLGILGKNGAGKSTLLKMITGVAFPTSGTIEVNGRISSLLELGTAFNMELTGYENIYQNGEIFGLTKEEIKEKEQEIIDFADIGDHLSQPVKTYSSGMFARLAFACAINVDPDILIVDEVLSVGDIAFQLKCFKKFEDFKNRGKTILFVSHSISDIIRNCTRAILIDKGKKIFDGSVKDATEKYKKLIVGLDVNDEDADVSELDENENLLESDADKIVEEYKGEWKNNYPKNDKIIEYGNGRAEVIDYGIFDLNGTIINAIENDKEVVLRSKIKFNDDVMNPIFTMTMKDFNGMEITGTNTNMEKIYTGEFKKGDVVVVEFRQKFSVAPNNYTLSFSCTNITEKGELEVLSRKYDALLVEVISSKDTVGILRIDPKITIKKINE